MRARNIKPSLCESDVLAETGPHGMLLYAVLPMQADREGRLEDRPKKIKALAFPYFDFDVDAMLGELAARGFVIRYESDGTRYIQIVNWHDEQRPHSNEKASVIPEYEPPWDEALSTMVESTSDHGGQDGAPWEEETEELPNFGQGESTFDHGAKPFALIPDTGSSDSGSMMADTGSQMPDGGSLIDLPAHMRDTGNGVEAAGLEDFSFSDFQEVPITNPDSDPGSDPESGDMGTPKKTPSPTVPMRYDNYADSTPEEPDGDEADAPNDDDPALDTARYLESLTTDEVAAFRAAHPDDPGTALYDLWVRNKVTR